VSVSAILWRSRRQWHSYLIICRCMSMAMRCLAADGTSLYSPQLLSLSASRCWAMIISMIVSSSAGSCCWRHSTYWFNWALTLSQLSKWRATLCTKPVRCAPADAVYTSTAGSTLVTVTDCCHPLYFERSSSRIDIWVEFRKIGISYIRLRNTSKTQPKT